MDRNEQFKQVQELRKTMPVSKACEQVGLGVSTYGYYLNKSKKQKQAPKRKKSRKPAITQIPVAPRNTGRIVMIMGEANDVIHAMRNMQ